MARCRCSSICSCSVIAGTGATVTGIGSPGNPYVVSADGGGGIVFPLEQVRLTNSTAVNGVTTNSSGVVSARPTDARARSHTTTGITVDDQPAWIQDFGSTQFRLSRGLYHFYFSASSSSDVGVITTGLAINTDYYDVPLGATGTSLVPNAFGARSGNVSFPFLATGGSNTANVTWNSATLSAPTTLSYDLTIVRLGDITPTY